MKRKDYIQSVAKKIIEKDGFAAVNVKRICEEGSIAKSTFYYIYSSVNELLREMFKEDFVISGESLKFINKYESPLDKLYAYHILYLANIESAGYESSTFIAISSLSSEKKAVSKVGYLTTSNSLIPYLKKAQTMDLIKNKSDADTLSKVITNLISGCCYTWCVFEGSYMFMEDCLSKISCVYGVEDYDWYRIYSDYLTEFLESHATTNEWKQKTP